MIRKQMLRDASFLRWLVACLAPLGGLQAQLTVTALAAPEPGYLAFDLHRDRLVLAGTTTHEFDGQIWRTVGSVHFPSRIDSMVYDAARGRCVMVAQSPPSAPSPNDTWEWDGVDWHLGPLAPGNGQLVYHSGLG